MESTLYKDRHFIECSCGDPLHLLCFDIDLRNKSIEVYFTWNWQAPFYKRLIHAFHFIFNSQKYKRRALWDEVIIDNRNIKDFEKTIRKIKNQAKLEE